MDKAANGWINGFIGVVIFAGSLPATRAAVIDLSPTFLTCARASIAALLGLALLLVLRQRRPDRRDLPLLAVVALCVVVGFPLLSALGGIAAVGQLQLLQPFFGFGLASLFLHETVSGTMLVATLGAVICVGGAKKFAA